MTAAEIVADVRGGAAPRARCARGAPRPGRGARARDPRVQPGVGGRRAPIGRRGRRRGGAWRRSGAARRRPDRDQGQPAPRADSRRPALPASSKGGGRRTTRPSCSGCGPRARCSSARPTSTNSRWGRPPRTRRSARPATRTTHRACPAVRAAVRRPRSRPGSPRSASARIPAARSASRRRCAVLSGSNPRTEPSRGTA